MLLSLSDSRETRLYRCFLFSFTKVRKICSFSQGCKNKTSRRQTRLRFPKKRDKPNTKRKTAWA